MPLRPIAAAHAHASFLDDRPRGGQAPRGEDHAGVSDLLLEYVASSVLRQPADYEPVKVQAVEATKIGGVQGSLETDRSSNGTFSTATGGGELAEALGVVDALAADQADARAVLQREHAPAVVLLS